VQEVYLHQHRRRRHSGPRKDRCRHRIGHQVRIAILLEDMGKLDDLGAGVRDVQRRVDGLLPRSVHVASRPLSGEKLQK